MRRRKTNKAFLILVLITVFALGVYCFVYFEIKIRPMINSVAVASAKNVATKAVNQVVDQVMSETEIRYNDLVVLQKDNQNRITALTTNSVSINKLKAELTTRIQEKMSSLDPMSASIPLGTLFNQSIFSGLGPKIKIRLIPVGYTNIDIKSGFVSAGINQTKHIITLQTSTHVSVLLPIASTSAQVNTQIAIAETIIIGAVPDTYTNVTGASDEPQDIVLNMTP